MNNSYLFEHFRNLVASVIRKLLQIPVLRSTELIVEFFHKYLFFSLNIILRT